MAQPVRSGTHTLSVTVSIGVATRQGESDPAQLIQRADEALYRAKAKGRNAYSC